jgi:gliding motility-associated-like protein
MVYFVGLVFVVDNYFNNCFGNFFLVDYIDFLKTSQASIKACDGSTIDLSVSGGVSYNWQPCYNLNTCSAPGVLAKIDSNIIYTISAMDMNGCTDTIQIAIQKIPDKNEVYVPTAFTPNQDGLNDKFGVISDAPLADFQFSVYNRWGKPVFASKDPNKKWDGSFNNIQAGTGTYVWLLSYKNASGCVSRKLRGVIVLIR